MSSESFTFQQGNLRKLLAIPVYVAGWILSWLIRRKSTDWVFGSGLGVGEGALALARELRRTDPNARITWLVADSTDSEIALKFGFLAETRGSFRGFWATLRARTIVVTHGLGDVNRFGVFRGTVVNLWHGAPLKRLHLDSPVTTEVTGPKFLHRLLERMYIAGANQVSLYVVGSPTSAERLRSAFRVAPGKVRVLGDPRDDELVIVLRDPSRVVSLRTHVTRHLGLSGNSIDEPIVLYAPTWRDGADDPALLTANEAQALQSLARELRIQIAIRPHPLSRGSYANVLNERVHMLGSDLIADITPYLASFDVLITDYSSIALDFALTERPILWFAPDALDYELTRGLYEPLTVTAEGALLHTWAETAAKLRRVIDSSSPDRHALSRRSKRLAARFHTFTDGASAARVLKAIAVLHDPTRALIAGPKIFFESFYGAAATCNPLAIDREIARQKPEITRYWSVAHENVAVPNGAIPVLVGGAEWTAARNASQLLIVNDWLRYRFRRRSGQTVLQTWHGTPLKRLALGRPGVSLRTRLAIRRESAHWHLLLSGNDHTTAVMRDSYAFRGDVLQTGYPRTDRLAKVTAGHERVATVSQSAKRRLNIDPNMRVLLYAPTWRDDRATVQNTIGVAELAHDLGADWLILVRGHSRTSGIAPADLTNAQIRDVTAFPDVNELLLAADLLVTDYSSVMFDASVAALPTVFFVPDLSEYRDEERGFTFDFERFAPGPLVAEPAAVTRLAQQITASGRTPEWVGDYRARMAVWNETFTPNDDGAASARVVHELIARQLI